uniref:YbjN domain-containing protein n=1 Tax=Alexandrium catenella TaxID=2925 RepID=A0A7S1W716_ALECA
MLAAALLRLTAASYNAAVEETNDSSDGKAWDGRDAKMLDELLEHFGERPEPRGLCGQAGDVLRSVDREAALKREDDNMCFYSYTTAGDRKALLIIDLPARRLRLGFVVRKPQQKGWTLARSMVFSNKWNEEKAYTKLLIDKEGDFDLRWEQDLEVVKELHESLPRMLSIFETSVIAMNQELIDEIGGQDKGAADRKAEL